MLSNHKTSIPVKTCEISISNSNKEKQVFYRNEMKIVTHTWTPDTTSTVTHRHQQQFEKIEVIVCSGHSDMP
jgi:hypothetical protein